MEFSYFCIINCLNIKQRYINKNSILNILKVWFNIVFILVSICIIFCILVKYIGIYVLIIDSCV